MSEKDNNKVNKPLVLYYGQGELIAALAKRSVRDERWKTVQSRAKSPVLALLDKHPIDVLVLELNDNFADSVQLLQSIAEKHPHLIRIVLTTSLTSVQLAKVYDLVHFAGPLSIPAEHLFGYINQGLHTAKLINKPEIKVHITSLEQIPVLPEVYRNLTEALRSEDSTAQDIAEILERDAAMTAKIMQLVNSSFMGLSHHVYRVKEAVTTLGFHTLKNLVLSEHLFGHLKQNEALEAFSFRELYERSVIVARAAQKVCHSYKAPVHIQDKAFLAGLLHDFGVLLLANKDPDKYREVMMEAVTMDRDLHALEKLYFGVSHNEVAAYLLTLWQLPPQVVEAVLYHHYPNACKSTKFIPLTAVHVADALIPSPVTAMGCDMSSKLSVSYFKKNGMEKQLNFWQVVVAEYEEAVAFNNLE